MSREANKILKKLVFAGIFTLALAGYQKEAKAGLAKRYFPLNVGNSWTYTNYFVEPNDPNEPPPPGGPPIPPIVEFTFTIIGTEEIDGHTYYKFNDYFNIYPPPPNGEHRVTIGRETLFRYDSEADRVLMIWAGEDVIRYDFRGGVWTGGVYGLSRLKQSNVTCDVQAGEFSDCINFQFDWWSGGGPDAYAHGEYLAPNVGNIKFVRPGGDCISISEGERVTFELLSYTIVPEPAMIYYVDADANGVNDGSSWADAYNYLQDALTAAWNGDEIWVAEGIYKPDQGIGITPGDRTATFQLIDGVTIKGGYAGFGEPDANERDIDEYETILSGDIDGNDIDVNDSALLLWESTRAENSYHVVTAVDTDETAVFDGFTITAGNANGKGWPVYQNFGGGMYNDSGSPSIINCAFSDNSALNNGGGIYNWGGSPMLTNCTFSGNSAGIGGGIKNNNGSPRLTNCTFIGNSARSRGGGVYSCCGWTVLMLTNCIFKGNWSYGDGGGLLCDNGRLMMINCTFSGNWARRGGGIWYIDGNDRSQTLANCRFSGNLAHEGGGMYCTFSSPTLINCTFSGNSAEYGEGIYVEDSSNPTLTNCILWGNRNTNGTDESAQFDERDEFIINYCCVEGWNGHLGGVGNIEADPCFVEPGYWEDPCNTPYDPLDDVWVDGDYHLLPDSPCIDTGDPNYVAEPNETDLDGKPRIIAGRIDMGTYEYRPPVWAEVRIVPRAINLASKGKWITCYIWLCEGYNVADIDPNSVVLEDEIGAESLGVDENRQVAVARFSQSEVQGILAPGEVELTVSGELTDGTRFEGTDTIRVIDKGGGGKIKD